MRNIGEKYLKEETKVARYSTHDLCLNYFAQGTICLKATYLAVVEAEGFVVHGLRRQRKEWIFRIYRV